MPLKERDLLDSITGQRTDVSLEGVSKGIYFVTFVQGDRNKTFKLSVVK